MTYLEYITQAKSAKTPLEMTTLALQYYAETVQHPQRMAFDRGSVARGVLKSLRDDAPTTGVTTSQEGSQ